jgi:hypothetical protein
VGEWGKADGGFSGEKIPYQCIGDDPLEFRCGQGVTGIVFTGKKIIAGAEEFPPLGKESPYTHRARRAFGFEV